MYYTKYKKKYPFQERLMEKRHEKDPDNFQYARIIISAPEESDLHEITMTYIKKLDNNGAWDFQIEHIDEENMNIVTFKSNLTMGPIIAFSELHFHCEHSVKWEFVKD